MGLAAQLSILRAKKKASLQDIANEVGVSKTHIWQLEKGITKNPTLELIEKLANLYDVSTQSLIGENPALDESDEFAFAMYRKIGSLDEIDRKVIKEMVDAMMERKKIREHETRQDEDR